MLPFTGTEEEDEWIFLTSRRLRECQVRHQVLPHGGVCSRMFEGATRGALGIWAMLCGLAAGDMRHCPPSPFVLMLDQPPSCNRLGPLVPLVVSRYPEG